MNTAREKLVLLVVADFYPTLSVVMNDRTDEICLLPDLTQFGTRGSVTGSNGSLRWRDQVVARLFESLPDHTIMASFATKFGFAGRVFRNIAVEDGTLLIEDPTRALTVAWGRSAIPGSRRGR